MTRVRLLRDIRSDLPFPPISIARAGEHEAKLNPQGAVSVRAEDGSWLGVKPDEFEWIGEPPHGPARGPWLAGYAAGMADSRFADGSMRPVESCICGHLRVCHKPSLGCVGLSQCGCATDGCPERPNPCDYVGCDKPAVGFVGVDSDKRACGVEHARSISAKEPEGK